MSLPIELVRIIAEVAGLPTSLRVRTSCKSLLKEITPKDLVRWETKQGRGDRGEVVIRAMRSGIVLLDILSSLDQVIKDKALFDAVKDGDGRAVMIMLDVNASPVGWSRFMDTQERNALRLAVTTNQPILVEAFVKKCKLSRYQIGVALSMAGADSPVRGLLLAEEMALLTSGS
jgi:hypothetical protein